MRCLKRLFSLCASPSSGLDWLDVKVDHQIISYKYDFKMPMGR